MKKDRAQGYKDTNDQLHSDAIKRINLSITDEHDARLEAIDDFRFYQGDQWPEDVRQDREADGRPCLTHNRLKQIVKQFVGDLRQNRPACRFLPVDSQSDPKVSEIIEGLYRHVWYQSAGDVALDMAGEHAFVGGVGYWRIVADYCDENSFEQEIKILPIHSPFSVYIDQGHKLPDFTDMRWAAITEYMPRDEYEREYGDVPANDIDNGVGDFDGDGQWLSEDSVRVAEYYWVEEEQKDLYKLIDGSTILKSEFEADEFNDESMILDVRKTTTRKVMWIKLSGYGILEGPKVVPCKYIPVVPVFGDQTNIDGTRIFKGGIRDSKDAQRMYNYHSSIMAEQLANQPKAPMIVDKAGIEGLETIWDDSSNKPYPYLPINSKKMAFQPFRVMPAPVASGLVEQIRQAESDMKATSGMYDAALGNRSNETSGRAILARQRESDTATFTFVDNVNRAMTYSGKVFIDMLPKIYDSERIIRIEGEDGKTDQVSINQLELVEGVERVLNDLTIGKYDVRVTTGPSYMTQRIESQEMMMEFMRALPQQAPIIADLLAANMDIKNADLISERLKALLPPQVVEADKIREAEKEGGMPGADPTGMNPEQPQQEQAPPDPEQMAAMQKMQMDAAMAKMNMATEQQKTQLFMVKSQGDIEAQQIRNQHEKLKLEQEKLKYEQEVVDLQIKQQELAQGKLDTMRSAQPQMTPEVVMQLVKEELIKIARQNNQSVKTQPVDSYLPNVPQPGRF